MSEGPRDYEVGYGRPPEATRFRKGKSGNVRGRPRKSHDAAIDVAGLLDEPVKVREGGEIKQMQPKEVALRKTLKQALEGDRRSIGYLLDLFERYGLLAGSFEHAAGDGVLTLPSTMPFAMAMPMAQRFGRPPWTKAQLKIGRQAYLAARDEEQASIDDAIGYPDLLAENET